MMIGRIVAVFTAFYQFNQVTAVQKKCTDTYFEEGDVAVFPILTIMMTAAEDFHASVCGLPRFLVPGDSLLNYSSSTSCKILPSFMTMDASSSRKMFSSVPLDALTCKNLSSMVIEMPTSCKLPSCLLLEKFSSFKLNSSLLALCKMKQALLFHASGDFKQGVGKQALLFHVLCDVSQTDTCDFKEVKQALLFHAPCDFYTKRKCLAYHPIQIHDCMKSKCSSKVSTK